MVTCRRALGYFTVDSWRSPSFLWSWNKQGCIAVLNLEDKAYIPSIYNKHIVNIILSIYYICSFHSFWIGTSFSVSPWPWEWLFFSEPLTFTCFELSTFSLLPVVYGFRLIRILFWAFNFRSLSMAARFLRRRFILILLAATRNLAWLFSAWTTVFHLNKKNWKLLIRKQNTKSAKQHTCALF